jgi:ribonucleotide monophosphatase NagD (HAD superfamily)
MSDSPSPITPIVDGISAIADDYDGFVLDTAGVLHDGATPYPGALDALRHLRSRGKKVCLLTNQARRSASVGRLLDEIGIGPDLYDHLLTSGELTHQWCFTGRRTGCRIWAPHACIWARSAMRS